MTPDPSETKHAAATRMLAEIKANHYLCDLIPHLIAHAEGVLERHKPMEPLEPRVHGRYHCVPCNRHLKPGGTCPEVAALYETLTKMLDS